MDYDPFIKRQLVSRIFGAPGFVPQVAGFRQAALQIEETQVLFKVNLEALTIRCPVLVKSR